MDNMLTCSKVVTLKLSRKQEIAVRDLFDSNGWHMEILQENMLEPTVRSHVSTVSKVTCDENDIEQVEVMDLDGDEAATQAAANVDPSGLGGHDSDPEDQNLDDGQCPFCFMTPCIASVPQGWLGVRQMPRAGNNLVRKDKYRRYWKTMDRAGAWQIPQYIAKKRLSMMGEDRVIIRREIMPDCVLKLVRGYYPNPQGIPYMGHKWW